MHTLDTIDAASLRDDIPDFRPGDFFYAPTDQEALMTGTA